MKNRGELKKHYRFMTKVIWKLHLTHDPGLDFESQKINAMKTITGATGKSETWFADWITVLFHFLLLIRWLCLFVCFLNEWASLVAQTGKILPVMQETQVWPLGWEDPLERGIASYPLQYSWVENLMDRGLWSATVHAVAKSQTQLSDSHFYFFTFFNLKKKYQNIY